MSELKGAHSRLKGVCTDKGIMSEVREAPILRDQVEGRRELVPGDRKEARIRLTVSGPGRKGAQNGLIV